MNKVSDFEGRIIGCDRAFASVRKAQDNVKDAMLDDIIEIKEQILSESLSLCQMVELFCLIHLMVSV